MNTIRIIVSVDTLTGLKSTGGNYHLIATALKTDGSPLGDLNIPVSSSFTIPPSGLTFILNIPITDATYSIPDARFKVEIETDPAIHPASAYYAIYQNFPITNVASGGSLPDSDTLDRGVRVVVRNNRKARIINGQTTRIVPGTTPGNFRLEYAATKSSFNGANTVNAILMDGNMKDLTQGDFAAFLTAFKSAAGVNFPVGTKRFWVYCYYANPAYGTTLAQVRSNFWTVWGNPATFASNSYRTDHCMIEFEQ